MLERFQKIVREEGIASVFLRALGRVERAVRNRSREFRGYIQGTYSQWNDSFRLQSHLGSMLPESIAEAECIPAAVADLYLDHRFDLLGSGWVQAHHGVVCRGMGGHRYSMGDPVRPDSEGKWLVGRINPANLRYAQFVWQKVGTGFHPIDWQLDFKSGFRWSERQWAKRLRYGHLPGVDVKVPWELARMQHLPQMAIRAIALGNGSLEGQRLAQEARNQLLDFIATNPPGFGINWLCPMDVAIRASNWLVAWDLFRAAGLPLPADCEVILCASVYDHGLFIMNNLEWLPYPHRGNHYFAHICGLAFIAAYLPENQETNRWLAFAVSQLIEETLIQFYPDGGHFEGSVAYHRLCAEMALYTTALTLGLPEARLLKMATIDRNKLKYLPLTAIAVPIAELRLYPTGQTAQGQVIDTPFDLYFFEKLRSILDFFAFVMKPDGSFPQIGDNDSGRFFKLQPVYCRMTVAQAKNAYSNLVGYNDLYDSDTYYWEDPLNGKHLLNAAHALGWSPSWTAEQAPWIMPREDAESKVLMALTSRRCLSFLCNGSKKPLVSETAVMGQQDIFDRFWREKGDQKRIDKFSFKLPSAISASPCVVLSHFAHFGCFVFKHQSFYLLIRCIVQPGQKTGAHHHEDQLSVELDIDGERIINDPGSYVYTALPFERKRYRSNKAHFGLPDATANQIEPTNGIFTEIIVSPASVEYFGPNGFAAHVDREHVSVGLYIRIEDDEIIILHYGTSEPSEFDKPRYKPPPYSPGYGIQEIGRG